MANNPLQQYFRQPKLFIELPTSITYAQPGTFKTTDKLPIFGMTGMDELIMKTPDALLSGESLTAIISSCCPSVGNPWELSNIDVDTILTAIRIASYGNQMTVASTCISCTEVNEYELDLNKFMEHYKTCKFKNTIKVGELSIKIRPLTFKEANHYALANFVLQRKIVQIDAIEDREEQSKMIAGAFKEINDIQLAVIKQSVEEISTADSTVTDPTHIVEYLDNCDADTFKEIKNLFELNSESWKTPATDVTCSACNTANKLSVELNPTNFFGIA
jgi:hypothetical protein